MLLQKMQDSDTKKLRGRSAIEAAHAGITGEDEARLDGIISDLYGVDIEEAADIHLNYHVDRIFAALVGRGEEKGIKTNNSNTMFAEQLQRQLDLSGTAYQVAKGKLAETAAVDVLFRTLQSMENRSKDDRYVRFYG